MKSLQRIVINNAYWNNFISRKDAFLLFCYLKTFLLFCLYIQNSLWNIGTLLTIGACDVFFSFLKCFHQSSLFMRTPFHDIFHKNEIKQQFCFLFVLEVPSWFRIMEKNYDAFSLLMIMEFNIEFVIIRLDVPSIIVYGDVNLQEFVFVASDNITITFGNLNDLDMNRPL